MLAQGCRCTYKKNWIEQDGLWQQSFLRTASHTLQTWNHRFIQVVTKRIEVLSFLECRSLDLLEMPLHGWGSLSVLHACPCSHAKVLT